MLKSDSLFHISRVYSRNCAQCMAGHCPGPGPPTHKYHRTLQGEFLSSFDHCCSPDSAQGLLEEPPSRNHHQHRMVLGTDATEQNLGMLGWTNPDKKPDANPLPGAGSAALWCTGCKWSREMMQPHGFPLLCYRCGSFGLHPVYVILSITTQSAHQAQTK